MQLASLGSGSKGNATLLRCGENCVLIDCGYSLKQLEQRLQRIDLSITDISAVLLTHEHSDHGAGIARLLARHDIPLWTSVGSARALGVERFQSICGGQSFLLGDNLQVQAVTVPHDAAEPIQFVFTQLDSGRRLGILTDSGHITAHMKQAYDGVHALLLEFNYDEQMLQNGPYPYHLKRRVGGLHGHLSNLQSMQLLEQIDTSRLDCLIAAHISEKNNAPHIVEQLLQQGLAAVEPILATQQQGFDWVEI